MPTNDFKEKKTPSEQIMALCPALSIASSYLVKVEHVKCRIHIISKYINSFPISYYPCQGSLIEVLQILYFKYISVKIWQIHVKHERRRDDCLV